VLRRNGRTSETGGDYEDGLEKEGTRRRRGGRRRVLTLSLSKIRVISLPKNLQLENNASVPARRSAAFRYAGVLRVCNHLDFHSSRLILSLSFQTP